MAPADVIAVVDSDLERGASLVQALEGVGLDAVAVGDADDLAPDASFAGLLIVAAEAEQLAAQQRSVAGHASLAPLPWLALSVSDEAGAPSAAQAFALGASDFLRWPAASAELRARLQARLGSAGGSAAAPEARSAEPAPVALAALERYLDILQAAADGMVVLDFDGHVLFCNRAASALTGRAAEGLRGRRWADLIASDGQDRFAEARAAIARGEVPAHIDLPLQTAAGQRRIVNVGFGAVMREQRGLVVTLRDVTKERAMARELTKTKQFLQQVIDSSADAIVSADMRGRILLFNPAAERVYGYRADEVIGKMNVRALYPEGTAQQVMRQIRSSDGGEPGVLRGYETRLLVKDGSQVPVLLSAALIVHRGRPIGSVGVFEDLRAERHYRARLAEAQDRLRAQEEKAFIAELAGAAAHELNQPLTTVMGYAQMLARKLEAESKLRRGADRIVAESERMAEIVRKIGKLTKYQSKAYVGDTKIIDIERSVDSEPPVTGR